MILGVNVLEFALIVCVGCVMIAWTCDYGPEIYGEQKKAWRVKHPKKEKFNPEHTIQMPVGSFDPDATMTLKKIEPPVRRRHAKA